MFDTFTKEIDVMSHELPQVAHETEAAQDPAPPLALEDLELEKSPETAVINGGRLAY